MIKFVQDRPYAKPEAAAKLLMELIAQHKSEHGTYATVGPVNSAFLKAGGNVAEYGAGRDHALAQSWFTMHISGSRFVLPE